MGAEDEAAEFLLGLWRGGRHAAALPEGCRPATRAAGYAAQGALARRAGGSVRGWKIAATSEAGQQHINVDGPLAGRLLADRVTGPGETVALGANRMLVAEVEFVFRFARDLPPRAAPYGLGEVLDAVDPLMLGMELPDSRFTDFTAVGAPQLIADLACADRFVLGPAVPGPWRDADLAAHAVQARNGARRHDGAGAAALGDPRLALLWLVEELRQGGVTLAAGQFVTTGTCIVPMPIGPGDTVVGDYGAFGAMEVRLTQ